MEFKDTESQLEGIREIFEIARTEDGWDVTGEMLYSFYFVDKSVEKLEKLEPHLENQGFDLIGMFELGDDETGESTGEFLLHVDKVESHTPESLAARNVELQKLADEHEIESYDGWEFGELGDEDEEGEFDDDTIEEEE